MSIVFSFHRLACVFLLVLMLPAQARENLIPLSYNPEVVICDGTTDARPDFNSALCTGGKLRDVNPQNRSLWVLLRFDKPEALASIAPPYGIYLFGKASSTVMLNEQLLGNNGVVANDSSEVAGKMDSVFYVPEALLKDTDNQLVMHLSGHHSLVELGYPLHFLGVGQFGDPKRFVQLYSGLGLILLGAFSVGCLYFLCLSFGQKDTTGYRLFTALCLLGAGQLATEMSRGLFDYTYPWQDVRLLLVTACSCVFGTLLLIYSSVKVAGNHALHWIYAGVILTLLTVIFVPSFDAKTTSGIFVPLMVSLVQLLVFWYRTRDSAILRWFVVQLAVAITILVSSASFHEIMYFLIISIFLGYLFVQQALELRQQQVLLEAEQARLAKLEYKLAQNEQNASPTKLEVSVGGKTEFLVTSQIAYCKAAGDYVELHLNDGAEKLYSGALRQLEEALPSTFLRVHRSYLVNLSEVVSLATKSSGESNSQLKLGNGMQIPVSRRLLPSVRDSLKLSVS